jgi:hypothetical protein
MVPRRGRPLRIGTSRAQGEISGSQINNNVARDSGGGVYVQWMNGVAATRHFEVTNTTVNSNTATRVYGGGVNARGWVKFENVTANNNASARPTNLAPGADGVGIYAFSGEFPFRNVRTVGNRIPRPIPEAEEAAGARKVAKRAIRPKPRPSTSARTRSPSCATPSSPTRRGWTG